MFFLLFPKKNNQSLPVIYCAHVCFVLMMLGVCFAPLHIKAKVTCQVVMCQSRLRSDLWKPEFSG